MHCTDSRSPGQWRLLTWGRGFSVFGIEFLTQFLDLGIAGIHYFYTHLEIKLFQQTLRARCERKLNIELQSSGSPGLIMYSYFNR